MNFKLDPTKSLAIFLFLMAGASSFGRFSYDLLLHAFATIGLGLAVFYVYSKIFVRQKNIWNAIISILLLFLLLQPGKDFVIAVCITTFVTITIKFLVNYKGSTIINPIVFGILLANFMLFLANSLIAGLFGELKFMIDSPFVSWWGAEFKSYLSLGMIFAWIIFGIGVWRKWWLICTFLLATAALFFTNENGASFVQYLFSHSTIYFFTTIMLVDPKTSPITNGTQVIYAIVAAISYFMLSSFGIEYFELYAIAIANVSWLLMKKFIIWNQAKKQNLLMQEQAKQNAN